MSISVVHFMVPAKSNFRIESIVTEDQSRRQLDCDLAKTLEAPRASWNDLKDQTGRSAIIGLFLGGLAGCTSLLANVIGSVVWPAISGEPQHPLRIVQVYLTFPLGEIALQLNSGLTLGGGCVLYLLTGMLYGLFFEVALSTLFPRAKVAARLAICSILAIGVWVVNFYALLSWLQPLLFGGHWILLLIPWWVAAVTHLVFGWTMAFLYPLGTVKLKEEN